MPELILTYGIRHITKEMPMSPTTLKKRMVDPSGFTLGELTQLAKLVGKDFLDLVTLAKQLMDYPIKVPVSERGRSANKS